METMVPQQKPTVFFQVFIPVTSEAGTPMATSSSQSNPAGFDDRPGNKRQKPGLSKPTQMDEHWSTIRSWFHSRLWVVSCHVAVQAISLVGAKSHVWAWSGCQAEAEQSKNNYMISHGSSRSCKWQSKLNRKHRTQWKQEFERESWFETWSQLVR